MPSRIFGVHLLEYTILCISNFVPLVNGELCSVFFFRNDLLGRKRPKEDPMHTYMAICFGTNEDRCIHDDPSQVKMRSLPGILNQLVPFF